MSNGKQVVKKPLDTVSSKEHNVYTVVAMLPGGSVVTLGTKLPAAQAEQLATDVALGRKPVVRGSASDGLAIYSPLHQVTRLEIRREDG